MNEEQAVISNKSPISSIWLLPVLAALIGLWLLFKSFSDAGVDIIIKTDSAEGIVIGKTEVRYKGFPVGLVNDLDLEDLNTVLVSIEVNNSVKQYLSENSLFWLVKPEISLSGVSGLDTVITGNYFEILPEVGNEFIKEFTALKQPPPKSEDAPGLHVTLHAKELGSISHGSSVFYKQIKVGEVYGYDFAEDKSHIKINMLIEEQYKNLVKLNSRFWNASGIEMAGDLSGFKLRTQSLSSIIGGGIAFHTPELGDTKTIVENFTEYPLFEGFDEARAGIIVKMNFPRNSGIKAGITKVIFEGVEVGTIEDFVYNQAKGGVTASVLFDPRLEPYLLENMEFWLVKPNISLAGVSNIDRLLSGTYVSFRLGDGQPSREFEVLPSVPALKFTEEGLHLNIVSDSVDSLSFGSPVFYKNLKVGSIQDHKLSDNQRFFNVHIHIEKEYVHLVNSTSVFFEQGGVEVSGSLKGFTVKTAPIQSMLIGGVSFHTIDFDNADVVENGTSFDLNRNFEDALNTELVTIIADNKYDLTAGITKLMFADKQVGTVKDIKPSSDLKSSILTIGYHRDYKNLFKDNSKIWIVEPKLSSGNLAGFSALLTGTFIQVKPGNSTKFKNSFELLDKAPPSSADDDGLQVRLMLKNAGSIEKGTPITYMKMVIGLVDSVNFSDDGKSIEVAATIEDDYRHLVSTSSQFYQSSGIRAHADMTGMTVQTESLQSIIRGGIALDNTRANLDDLAVEMSEFVLHPNVDTMNQSGKEVNLVFNEVVDIKVNATVRHAGHIVGHVMAVNLNEDLTKTKLLLTLSKDHPQLSSSGSKFWLVKPEVSVARVANAKAYFTGNYIGVLPAVGEDKTDFVGLITEPVTTTKPNGVNIVLTSDVKGSINIDNPVYYRQVKVGRVLGVNLNDNSDGVYVYINIEEQHKHLVNNKTKFYNASGIKIDAGLFSGVKVDTTSIDAILAGGIAFATPEDNQATAIDNGHIFELNSEAEENWHNWKPSFKQ
ncbi:MlaD family protein [Thalassotalea psychrophila]|uniref:MlaD family protein n=1 Tax=Thalassotalea psychrophila TaxID=3065647 RepID=A0ABY9TP78_9GAMM|nr:MlaD family protein [Colwelliaceae bacterium SQ149]